MFEAIVEKTVYNVKQIICGIELSFCSSRIPIYEIVPILSKIRFF